MKMNYVLLGFGLVLVIVGLYGLRQSMINRYRSEDAAFLGLMLLGVGVFICIVAGWLIERDRRGNTNFTTRIPAPL